MLAWQVVGSTSNSLLIGNPSDGDVGVLSYDPATNHFLLNGVDTGVAVTGSNGSPTVRANAGPATGTTFVLDVSTAFPITGGFFPEHDAPGIRVEYDGGANPNHLHIVGGRVRVTPDARQAGTLRVANSNVNIVEYQNLKGGLHLADAAISIDARQDNGHQRWVLAEAGRVWIREYFPNQGTCVDPPECTQWIAPAVENLTEILDLTFAEGNLTSIYTGDGNDRITINLAGMLESSIGVKAGDGDDALLVIGSDESERIALIPGPTMCGGFNGGGHWYDPAFPYEPGACTTTNLFWWVAPGNATIEYLEVETRTVRGLGGDDRITGGPDADYLDGGSGDDLIYGAGGDLLTISDGGSCTFPGIGRCFPTFGSSLNEESADVIDGGAGDDILLGTAGDNILRGGAGNDILSGGDGDDSLNGGVGRNLFFAGRGADHVVSIGSDLVATGEFFFDFNTHVLQSILAEWTSPRPRAERVENIKTGSGGGLNPEWALNDSTHNSDGQRDRVQSRRAVDFLLATSEDEATWPSRRSRPRVALTIERVRRRMPDHIFTTHSGQP
jgi:Ca2+-binding RTX toxin-like protein